jgi:RecB family exonuclease
MIRSVISYSEVDTYRQCRLKHQLSYRENWRTAGEEAEALARGTLFHSVMEAHYGRLAEAKHVGDTPDAEMLYAAVSPFLYDRETGKQSSRQELVEWIYRGYVELYGLDSEWEIVAIEYPLEMPLPSRDGESQFILKGTADLIVRDKSVHAHDGLWVVDHKTCKNLPKGKDFDMEDQTGIYTLLLMNAGMDIRGAIYNHCRTYQLQRAMTMDERYKRTPTVRTRKELETLAFEAHDLMVEAYDRLDSYGDSIRDAPRSPDGERCGWKCGYTEACLAGRKSGPARTRGFLEDIGFVQHETKPGPTFNK